MSWIKGISQEWIQSGDGLRYKWYGSISEKIRAHKKGKVKVSQEWIQNPKLAILDWEDQFSNMSCDAFDLCIESDALGKITGLKEYGPDKTIVTTYYINRLMIALHSDYWRTRDRKKRPFACPVPRGVNPEVSRFTTTFSVYRRDEAYSKGKRLTFKNYIEPSVIYEKSLLRRVDEVLENLKVEPEKIAGAPDRLKAALHYERFLLNRKIKELESQVPEGLFAK